ncbi:hypothetical protein Lepto7375DRAFT_0227 [Leptolyngbya sp. PCC 7375]|nr:hypothetical protein Lepto7375DRAFT_0227 [Leptolyngbya sp. PCC 7375]
MLESYRSRETSTTSLRQGRSREGRSEGSQRQTCEPTNRNVIEGPDSWVSWHTTTKPKGPRNRVNDAVVQGQFTVLSGEVCPAAVWSATGVGLRAVLKGTDHAPNPTVLIGNYGSRTEGHLEREGLPTESYGDPDSPSDGNVRQAGQKSAEAIVAAVAVKGRTVSNKEEP